MVDFIHVDDFGTKHLLYLKNVSVKLKCSLNYFYFSGQVLCFAA
jgi:hypothetical protein